MNVVFAACARQDIADIYDSIGAHSPASAQGVEDAIRACCEGLAAFPFASVTTDEPCVRRLPLVRYPYAVFFRVDEARQLVEIARVIHAARLTELGRMPEAD